MRIAIDASRTTVARLTGTEHYALHLIRALIEHNRTLPLPHQLLLYFRDTPPDDLFPVREHVTLRVIPFARLWTHVRFAAALWRDKPDVTFVPAHTLPLLFPGRAAVTAHDLGYRYFPQAHSRGQRWYLDWTTRYSARRASVVLADSQATADDLQRFYGVPAAKISVVYPGVNPLQLTEIDTVQKKYGIPPLYFLYIGTLQPRKNIARLVQAYARYRQMTGKNTALVLAGSKGWLYDEAWTAGVDGVILTGYVDEADKGALYAGARALVFPSLYEGFGFPVLEAMGCGTPVICSSTSSLPELAGDAALLVNPLDVEAIAAAMQNITADETLRRDLIERGKAQAAKFTWAQAAEKLSEVLGYFE
ncbi:MAG: glycosyltransferase family 1 protein [Anaerolineae bacterium]